jgi:hypothetical protein
MGKSGEKLSQPAVKVFNYLFYFFRESLTEVDAAQMNLAVNIPETPGPFTDKDQPFKFIAETESEQKKLIFPPPAKQRRSTSSQSLDQIAKEEPKVPNKLSASTFFLNEGLNETGLDAIKTKRAKWYKVFMPPSKDRKPLEENSIVEQPVLEEALDPRKRPWYKMKKRKGKKQEKLAVLS